MLTVRKQIGIVCQKSCYRRSIVLKMFTFSDPVVMIFLRSSEMQINIHVKILNQNVTKALNCARYDMIAYDRIYQSCKNKELKNPGEKSKT